MDFFVDHAVGFALACAILAVLYGIYLTWWLLRQPAGNEKMQEIARAIHGVGSGRTQLAPELAAGLANQIRARSHGDTPLLTERERQVLELVSAGATNREIGEQLHMAEKTASVHVSRILAKLDVRSRTEAAAVAHRHGLAGAALT